MKLHQAVASGSRTATSSLRVPTYAPRFDVLRNLRPQSLSFADHASPMRSNIQQRLALHTSASSLANHFDTHQFVEELTREGLSRQQAEGVMAALAEVVDESIAGMSRTMVTKAEQEKLHYTQKVDFAQLKSELQLHEKNDLTLMKQENDQLRGDVEKLKQRLREEITRTMAGVRLDLNLEKGRIRDESSQQELKIKEVDTRIESEIAGLRTQIEQAKFSILQYLVGVATGAGALLLAYLRMFK
ncbi:hypothetical protein NliqN6_4699 [Naganishia liquefaciens]|uniref:DUF1640 domain-containing protein n=2 Tax=Naganishia TaxID=1851509 RepID=A0A8H3TW92_9TREE|nr:hypothetical protein NliqN6_4699 [Naganishia liquefaciens]